MPVIGVLPEEHAESVMDALANPEEVQRVFAMPLSTFLSRDEHSSRDAVMSSGGLQPDVPYRLHFFQLKNLPTCWGLTAGICLPNLFHIPDSQSIPVGTLSHASLEYACRNLN